MNRKNVSTGNLHTIEQQVFPKVLVLEIHLTLHARISGYK